jgi:hypothetical protein
VTVRKARVGFAVIKLRFEGAFRYLMRYNPKWMDVNFVGGHEKERDLGRLERTASRELWEEVPSIRNETNISLLKLTDPLNYGPVESRSRGDWAEYEVQFYLLKIGSSPRLLVENLSRRSKNLLVPQEELIEPRTIRLSGYVNLLNHALLGGVATIPPSSDVDLGHLEYQVGFGDLAQYRFAFGSGELNRIDRG